MKMLARQIAQRLWKPLQFWFSVRGSVEVGERFHLGPGSRVESTQGLSIGNDVYIGKYCSVVCDGSIGNQVLIANNVGLIGRNDHDHTVVGVGIRSAPWIGDEDYSGRGRERKLRVEDDVWIGFGAVIFTGVTIGRGAIVASGSVVHQDVGPYDIVAGNPALVVGRRFTTTQEIELHEKGLRSTL